MRRIKFWWMIPWENQPRLWEYFRVGPHCGQCIFKSPWLVIMRIDKGWEYRP